MTTRLSRDLGFVLVTAIAAAGLVGCESASSGSAEPTQKLPDVPDPTPVDPGTGIPVPEPLTCATAPVCDGSISVKPDGPALMITDPAVLAAFPLDKVLNQLLAYEGFAPAPVETMQRLFDTMNSAATGQFADAFHCDSPDNPATVNGLGQKLACPRAEGKLATSKGFFTKGDPDSFFPVAIVDRFDLTPMDASRCGQYRIIYAKTSGLTDPNDRVFLIFEASFVNPQSGCLESCRPIAQFWKGLEGKSTDAITKELSGFFFDGLPGFRPVIHPQHFGLGTQSQGYGGAEPGQIRVSMHMEDSWDMRELHFELSPTTGAPGFMPNTVKNNPPVALFGPAGASSQAQWYQQQFMWQELGTLAGKDLASIQMFTNPQFNGEESMLAGDKKNDYFTAATAAGDMTFVDAMNVQIQANALGADCPADDPLDAEAILHRATVLSCAGCHAPKEMIGPERSLGCGLQWPDSIGQSHVTEKGERSPALQKLFLPHRADVLSTFLQSCDWVKINGNLQPNPQGGGGEKVVEDPSGDVGGQIQNKQRTLGGSVSH